MKVGTLNNHNNYIYSINLSFYALLLPTTVNINIEYSNLLYHCLLGL